MELATKQLLYFFKLLPRQSSALCALRSISRLCASSARLRLLSPDPDPGRWTPAPEPGAGELGAAGGQSSGAEGRIQTTIYLHSEDLDIDIEEGRCH